MSPCQKIEPAANEVDDTAELERLQADATRRQCDAFEARLEKYKDAAERAAKAQHALDTIRAERRRLKKLEDARRIDLIDALNELNDLGG